MVIVFEEATSLYYKVAQNLLRGSDKSTEKCKLFLLHLPQLFCSSPLPHFIPCLYLIYFFLT